MGVDKAYGRDIMALKTIPKSTAGDSLFYIFVKSTLMHDGGRCLERDKTVGITIKDIAAKSNVSCSTVSRVISNNPNVSRVTREKVEKAIKELGYNPSHIARGLVTGKIDVVALIVGDIRNPFYAELTRVIRETLSKFGYLTVLSESDYDAAKEENYIRSVAGYGFSGIIMFTAMETQSLINQLENLACPVVLLNRYLPSYETDVVAVDNYLGGFMAARHLLELKHHKVAVLIGPRESSASSERLRGFKDGYREHGIGIPEERIIYGNLKMDSGYQFAHRLVEEKGNISAVFCGNDLMAIGLMEGLDKYNLRVPEDFSIVGYDDIDMGSLIKVKLTTVSQPVQEMGKMAAEILTERMRGSGGSYRRIMLTPRLIVRESTMEYRD